MFSRPSDSSVYSLFFLKEYRVSLHLLFLVLHLQLEVQPLPLPPKQLGHPGLLQLDLPAQLLGVQKLAGLALCIAFATLLGLFFDGGHILQYLHLNHQQQKHLQAASLDQYAPSVPEAQSLLHLAQKLITFAWLAL